MRALPFRKYRIFYLRLGFLKLLVHVLPPIAGAVERCSGPASARSPFRASGERMQLFFRDVSSTEGVASTLHRDHPRLFIRSWMGHDIELVTRGKPTD